MIQRIRMYVNKNRNMINITMFTFISTILLFVTFILDYKNPILKENIPDLILLSKDVSSSFLLNLAGVFLTVTTFTFTTILTILNKYSSEYTPRVVQDFIDQPYILSLFGIFIGGFFYSVLSLTMIQNVGDDTKVVSGTIGMLYAMASMIYFILFVRTVLKGIKISNVIENIYNKASALISKESKDKKQVTFDYNIEDKKCYKIHSSGSGYLYNVDNNSIASVINERKSDLIINSKIGDFIYEGLHIADFCVPNGSDLSKEEIDEILEGISKGFIYSNTINDQDDYHHEIRNLVEICLRAISPGINDPNTAIICIRKISMLLSESLANYHEVKIIETKEESRIIYKLYDIKEELYFTFYQIIFYGKSDPSIAKTLLEGLYLIYFNSNQTVKNVVSEFYDYTYETCLDAMETELDKEQLAVLCNDFKLICQN